MKYEFNALDMLIARPIGIAVGIIGTGIFILSLPFSIPTKSVDAAAKIFIVEPFQFSFDPVEEIRGGARVLVRGREMGMYASYSYLGLIGHPRINKAANILAGTKRIYDAGNHLYHRHAVPCRIHPPGRQAHRIHRH
jgi:hypothetical protein